MKDDILSSSGNRSNYTADEIDRARLIEAEWADEQANSTNLYSAEINIYAVERQGLVYALSKIFNEENINLTGMNVRVSKQGKATISVKFDIHSKEQLMKIVAKIRNIEGVLDIERTSG